MKNLAKSTKDSWTETKKVFNDALKRLSQTFSAKKQDDDFKAREADLLKSMYGNTNITTGKLIDVKVDESNAGSSVFADTGIGPVRSWNLFKKNIQQQNSEIKKIAEQEASNNTSKDVFSTIMHGYIDDVFIDQRADVELATFSEVKDITPAFDVL